MFINKLTMEEVDRSQFAREHPDLILPLEPDDAFLAPVGYAVLNFDYPGDLEPGFKHVRDGVEKRNGKYYAKYKVEPWNDEELSGILHMVKEDRNQRLYACDWTQLPDAQLTTEQVAAWAAYRQELRDVTKQSGCPVHIDWPQPPVDNS